MSIIDADTHVDETEATCASSSQFEDREGEAGARVRPAAVPRPGQRSASNAYLRPIHAPRGAPMPRNCSATGPTPAVGPKMCPGPVKKF